MKREFATLAHSFNGDIDSVIGWYVSRKLNGWGCLWDGGVTRGMPAYKVPFYFIGGDSRSNKTIYSTGLWTIGRADKYGIRPKVIHAPDWFLDLLPSGIPVQGELWNNDNLQSIKSICGGSSIAKKNDPLWKEIKFMVYNYKPFSVWIKDCLMGTLPDVGQYELSSHWQECYDRFRGMKQSIFYDNLPFKDRLTNIYTHCKHNMGTVLPVMQRLIECREDFDIWLDEAVKYGWEGNMLTNPSAPYETRRSYNLLKVKPTFDAEATIIDYENGKTGKNVGKMGALVCCMTWDESVMSVTGGNVDHVGRYVNFCVSGFKDYQRDWEYVNKNYKKGDTIKFTFSGVSIYGTPQSCNISH